MTAARMAIAYLDAVQHVSAIADKAQAHGRPGIATVLHREADRCRAIASALTDLLFGPADDTPYESRTAPAHMEQT